jgi:hypothetical protein
MPNRHFLPPDNHDPIDSSKYCDLIKDFATSMQTAGLGYVILISEPMGDGMSVLYPHYNVAQASLVPLGDFLHQLAEGPPAQLFPLEIPGEEE